MIKAVVNLTAAFVSIGILTACAGLVRTDPAVLSAPITHIYSFEDMESSEIYRMSRLWVSDTFISADDVINFDDPESFALRGRAIARTPVQGDMFNRQFFYNFSIDVDGSRARLQFNNFRESTYYSGSVRVVGIDGSLQNQYDAIERHLNGVAASYENYIRTPEEAW
ncbi:DUF4468 domain-containing protein [Salinispirillum sp. LH 10-3-1]|uniref:DUF4468 domain-containing protein n=1 Tax=Salinispirillum sp. LH 10-3-1 TaxID=2952525 RepID=A0AB38YII6_9GAMM